MLFFPKKKLQSRMRYMKFMKFIFSLVFVILIIIMYIISFNIKFIDFLPRTNVLEKPKNLKEIFNSRRLYVSNSNITLDYIKYIRSKDINYNNKIPANEDYSKIKFDENSFIRRKDQYNFSEFRNICNVDKLLTFNKFDKYKLKKKPLISVILPTYNKRKELFKSLRSIQLQSLKNIEIMIVDDFSEDLNSTIYETLLKSDPRIRIITHLKNMGVWRSRIDGFLYSKGKYVIHFDPSDLYEDNYVLEDLYNIIEKYHLDSVKMLFRSIYQFDNLTSYNIEINDKINYTQIAYSNINDYNSRIMTWAFGVVWNRLVRSDIYSKGLCLLSETVLNFYKNLWEDRWWSIIADQVSNNLLIVKRYGYLYFRDNKGAGAVHFRTEEQRDTMIQEFVKFLYFKYDLLPQKSEKKSIIRRLIRLKNSRVNALKSFKTNFYILDNFLVKLLKDPYISKIDKIEINKMLIDSLERQNDIIKKRNK
jgi:glycosyltransferase involved in cell wall biosynthesis